MLEYEYDYECVEDAFDRLVCLVGYCFRLINRLRWPSHDMT